MKEKPDQEEKPAPELAVDYVFIPPLDVCPSFRLAYRGVQKSQILDPFHDFPDAVAVLVKRPSGSFEVPGVEGTFGEAFMKGRPEIVLC